MAAVIASTRPAPAIGGAAQDRRIHGEGTPEHAWRRWDGLDALPPIGLERLAPRGARIIVVSPHPDDEVLACGGAVAMLARAGHEIVVVGVTDGEGSHRGSAKWTPRLLAQRRGEERAHGLRELGLDAPALTLGIADGGVTADEATLAQRLRGIARRGDVLITTWRFDGHPDHEAAGRAASTVAAELGCRCWEAPVWMWHWARPADPLVPWQRLWRLALDVEARERKRHAIAAHASQVETTPGEQRAAVVPAWALARLLRPFEVFIDSDGLP